MAVSYANLPQAASLREKLEALNTARVALTAADAREVVEIGLGPRQGSGIPEDTVELWVGVKQPPYSMPEWPTPIGYPLSLRTAMRNALISWLSSEITATRAQLTALGADLTGAPV